jgi:dihydroorotate dehydrogenase electron transfer subunit
MADNRKSLKLTDKPVSISLEMRMACGLGVCYGCTIRTKNGLKQVCKDGPVFDLNDVIWDEMTRV